MVQLVGNDMISPSPIVFELMGESEMWPSNLFLWVMMWSRLDPEPPFDINQQPKLIKPWRMNCAHKLNFEQK